MLTDAHCHPFDLEKVFPAAEETRRRLGVVCAASASGTEEFAYHEELARKAKAENAAAVLACFALHPQLPVFFASSNDGEKKRVTAAELQDGLALLEKLAKEGRLAAIGETGFDLYNAAFRETEKIQDDLFAAHLEAALCYDLPLVLHVRRAMHKVFAHIRSLKKCKSVIFHSWPGTAGEGESLLKKGVNAYFSFGTTILLNHREAMRCCAAFPVTRLLTETDAPYQPLRGKEFSSWEDLPRVIEAAAALRDKTGSAAPGSVGLEQRIAENFAAAFGLRTGA
jgi:TatD DNase family protein